MLYEFDLAIPPNTLAAVPLTREVTLAPGRIIALAVQFPAGCAGLAHAQICADLHTQWPSNPDTDISGEAALIEWQESYDLDPTAPRLRLVGWNLDDTWPHTITFRINVLGQEVLDQQAEALSALQYLYRWFTQRTAT